MTGRYKAYVDFSTTGEVIIEDFPEHWSLTRIKFNSLVKARVGWHGLKSDDFTDVGPYLVTGSDFKGKFIQWKDCYHCDVERYEQDPYIQLTNGDLLITKDGTIGKVALVSELDGKATLNSGVFVVRPLRSDFTTQYYYWLLLSRAFTDFVDYYKTGSTIAHLYQETFVNFKYPLPPYEEQQKIANFLDHETAKIDTLITKQEKLIELLKEKRQAVISHAVTKGLNPDAPMKDSGVEWLGEVPEHWHVKKLKHFGVVIGGFAFKSTDFTDSGYPVVKISNVSHLNLDWGDRSFLPNNYAVEHKDYIAPKGSLVFAMTRPVISGGIKVFLMEDDRSPLINQRVGFMKIENQSSAFFILQSSQSNSFLAQFTNNMTITNQPNISGEGIGSISIPFPPQCELTEINKKLTKLEAIFKTLTVKSVEQIQLLKERKTALISAAVTGKIDVRDWQGEA
ncbi:restriction endonuclease subunit S [Vibrio sp.]|uniref:restriction endonuclease subunit S n=1 Tax=Vibrio sp. TaxID=678 RepID=UPI003F6D77FA